MTRKSHLLGFEKVNIMNNWPENYILMKFTTMCMTQCNYYNEKNINDSLLGDFVITDCRVL